MNGERIFPYGKTVIQRMRISDDANPVYLPTQRLPVLRPRPVHVLSDMLFENALEFGEVKRIWRY